VARHPPLGSWLLCSGAENALIATSPIQVLAPKTNGDDLTRFQFRRNQVDAFYIVSPVRHQVWGPPLILRL